ncbi:TPA: exosortase/archaeosortase family protein [Candidatus Bathyarchaeota archaeon]|nr:exosortase/archaeosortase family protein [Candidatus Bathyarchaeota archaeon]
MRAKAGPTVKFLLYALGFSAISCAIYFLPDYGFLKAATAEHSALVLSALGMEAKAFVSGGRAFVNQFEIAKECTGIQVVAVFSGFILPLPRVPFKVKAKAIALVSLAVYVGNVLRIVVEVWMLYNGVLPWSQAHGPLGTVLSIFSVFIFFLMAERCIPQIGRYLDEALAYLLKRISFIGRGSREGN